MCACWILYNSASSGNLGIPPPSFLVHMDFLMGLALYYSNYQTLNFAKTYRIIKRNAVWANADNCKWLQASSSIISHRWQVSLSFSPPNWKYPTTLWHTLWELQICLAENINKQFTDEMQIANKHMRTWEHMFSFINV